MEDLVCFCVPCLTLTDSGCTRYTPRPVHETPLNAVMQRLLYHGLWYHLRGEGHGASIESGYIHYDARIARAL